MGQILEVDPKKSSVVSDLEDANIPSLLSVLKNTSEDDLKKYVSRYNGSNRPDNWNVYGSLRDDLGYSPNGSF